MVDKERERDHFNMIFWSELDPKKDGGARVRVRERKKIGKIRVALRPQTLRTVLHAAQKSGRGGVRCTSKYSTVYLKWATGTTAQFVVFPSTVLTCTVRIQYRALRTMKI